MFTATLEFQMHYPFLDMNNLFLFTAHFESSAPNDPKITLNTKRSRYWHMGRFSKFLYLDMKLGHWLEVQKLHRYSLSTLVGQNWAYYGKRFSRYGPIFKICYVWPWTWQLPTTAYTPCLRGEGELLPTTAYTPCPRGGAYFRSTATVSEICADFQIATFEHETWAKVPEVAHILPYIYHIPQRCRIELLFALWATVPKYRKTFKIAIFGHETFQPKDPEVAHMLSFYSRGQNWTYFGSMGSGSRDTGPFSRLPYFRMGFWHWPNFKSCTYTRGLPQGVEIELTFALRAAASEILADFQNCHIWAWNLATVKIPEIAHVYAAEEMELIFTLWVTVKAIQQPLILITLIR